MASRLSPLRSAARPSPAQRSRVRRHARDSDSRALGRGCQVRYGRGESTRQYYSRGGALVVPGAYAGAGSDGASHGGGAR